MSECGRVHVGVALLMRDEQERLLLVRRAGSHGAGTWAAPGGHVEQGDVSLLSAASRECLEEVGVVPAGMTVSGWTWDHHPEGFVGMTFYVTAAIWTGEPTVMEPDKITELGFFPDSAWPTPMFEPLAMWLGTRDTSARWMG